MIKRVKREMPTSLLDALEKLNDLAIAARGKEQRLNIRPIRPYDFDIDSWVWEWDVQKPVRAPYGTFIVISGIWAKELIEVTLETVGGHRLTFLTTGGLNPYHHILDQEEAVFIKPTYKGGGSTPTMCEFSILGLVMEPNGMSVLSDASMDM